MKPQEQQDWTAYAADPSTANRNRLIERYLPGVRHAAAKLHAKLPASVDVDDLVSAGVFGLIDAIAAFEPDRGLLFDTFLRHRVRGAMMDSLRDADWVPRLARMRSTRYERARMTLVGELGREPSIAEAGERMGIEGHALELAAADFQVTTIDSLSRKTCETETGKAVALAASVIDGRAADPSERIDRDEFRDRLFRGLGRDEAMIVQLYCLDGVRMRDVGQAIGISESRVSQMLANLLGRLKAKLTPAA